VVDPPSGYPRVTVWDAGSRVFSRFFRVVSCGPAPPAVFATIYISGSRSPWVRTGYLWLPGQVGRGSYWLSLPAHVDSALLFCSGLTPAGVSRVRWGLAGVPLALRQPGSSENSGGIH
jgi:hypothetical protein